MAAFAKLQIKRSTAITVAAVIAVGLLSYWLTTRDWLVYSYWWQKSEGELIDHRYQKRGERDGDTNIVLVGVESTSMTLDTLRPEDIQASPILQHMLEPLPWNREVFAATLEKLVQAGARVVVFDFVFASSKDGDDEFAEKLEKYRNKVVLASMMDMNEFRYVAPNERLWPRGTNEAGLVNVWADADGTVRRGRYRTSLIREDPRQDRLAKIAAVEPDNLIHMTALAVKKFTGRVDTPPYDHDNFIDFPGGWKYKSVPIERMFVKADWETPPINGGILFSNKIVIVGPLAEIYKDVHRTPFGVMAGPELQAQMMATLLNHSSLEEPSERYNTLLTIGMISAALAICLLASHAVMKAGLLLGTAIGFSTVCQFSFSHASFVIPMMSPLFGLLSTGSIGVTLQFFVEQMERRRYRNVLDRYVSKNVARQVLEDHRSFAESLSGQKKSVTILFSDIRGFTSMSEGSDPEHLVRQLNEYFEEMVGVVQDEKGTLQKFIGDAIMAAWGDVISAGLSEDARLAIKTALRMRAGLKKLNAKWTAAPNRIPLEIGIGVNHGEAVVGNIGSTARMEFTVLGDAINLAARLETATKQFHVDFLVGENAERLTRSHFIFRKVGLLTVKGRSRAVEAFTVLGERHDPVPPWLDRYHEAVHLFRAREFQKAGELFKAVSAEIGAPDFLCDLHLEWCERYLHDPPPADWAGNFVLKEK